MTGLKAGQTLNLAKKLGFQGPQAEMAAVQMARLYELFIALDATQVEVNPFWCAILCARCSARSELSLCAQRNT